MATQSRPETETANDDDDDDAQSPGQRPTLDDLSDDELIRCVNPQYEYLTWFYGIGESADVVQYHELNGFDPDRTTTRAQAEASIQAILCVSVVDRDVLNQARERIGVGESVTASDPEGEGA